MVMVITYTYIAPFFKMSPKVLFKLFTWKYHLEFKWTFLFWTSDPHFTAGHSSRDLSVLKQISETQCYTQKVVLEKENKIKQKNPHTETKTPNWNCPWKNDKKKKRVNQLLFP